MGYSSYTMPCIFENRNFHSRVKEIKIQKGLCKNSVVPNLNWNYQHDITKYFNMYINYINIYIIILYIILDNKKAVKDDQNVKKTTAPKPSQPI